VNLKPVQRSDPDSVGDVAEDAVGRGRRHAVEGTEGQIGGVTSEEGRLPGFEVTNLPWPRYRKEVERGDGCISTGRRFSKPATRMVVSHFPLPRPREPATYESSQGDETWPHLGTTRAPLT
jgi:hypothetical protein